MSAQRWTLQDRLNYYASTDRVRGCVRAIAGETDGLTYAQQTAIWRLCGETECKRLFGCGPGELSKAAASVLLDYLKECK